MKAGSINVRGLVKRGNVYYLRRRVPMRLVRIVEQDVIIRSLRTKGWVHALDALAQCEQALGRLFELTNEAAKLDAKTAKRIFHDLLKRWMGSDEFGEMPSPAADISMIEIRLKDKDDDFRDLGADFIMQHDELGKLVSYSDIPVVEQIGHLLLRTLLEHSKQMQAIQSGQWNGKAFDPYFADAVGPMRGIAPEGRVSKADDNQSGSIESSSGGGQVGKGVNPDTARSQQIPISTLEANRSSKPTYSLEQVYAAYKKENEKICDFKRWYKFDYAFRILVHVFGRHHPVDQISQLEVRHVKDVLVQMPSNASKKSQLLGQSIDRQIAIAKKQDLKLISYATVNTHLSHMRLIFKWAIKNGYASANPFDDMTVKAPKLNKPKRRPFSEDHLRTFFTAPTYSGMRLETKWKEKGDLVVKNMRYWVPLIAAYTGMRQAEICQLNVGDVRKIKDILCICIDENDGQSVKSPAGIREVPIHPALLNDWGFESWLTKRRAAKGTKDTNKLFVEVEGRQVGKYADAFSKWFASFKKSLNINDPQLVFHSFRHTFIDLLRNADVDEALIQAIVGHEHGTITSKYGSGHAIDTKYRAIQKIKMPFEPPKLGKGIEVLG